MKPTPAQILPVYRRSLAKYEAEGDDERIAIQKRLIARLEAQT